METSNHLMVDIETMGTRPNAPIVTIGACYFEPTTGAILSKLYVAVDIQDAFQFGVPDGGTVKWWMTQSDKARNSAIEGKSKLADALGQLAEFYKLGGRNVQVWANGANFDPVLLEYAFGKCLNQGAPWQFWNVRCVRTIVELAKGFVEKPKEFGAGTAHNALDDAIFQARYVSKMWQFLRSIRPNASDDDDLEI